MSMIPPPGQSKSSLPYKFLNQIAESELMSRHSLLLISPNIMFDLFELLRDIRYYFHGTKT